MRSERRVPCKLVRSSTIFCGSSLLWQLSRRRRLGPIRALRFIASAACSDSLPEVLKRKKHLGILESDDFLYLFKSPYKASVLVHDRFQRLNRRMAERSHGVA